jgi:L-methionine (R)-S-oxide reductase
MYFGVKEKVSTSMFNIEKTNTISKSSTQDKQEFYNQLNTYLNDLISIETDWLAGISNASALLYLMLPHINWAGFYLYKGKELVLGPFQGKPACVRIAIGKGVCGTAAKTRKIQVVKDVNQFPGHIACDAQSQSEIVLPIIKYDRLIGVLDIDSPLKARFDNRDAEGLTKFIDIINENINWPEEFI